MPDLNSLQKETDFHNKRVIEEIESGGRLSFVYKSMANAISMPREMLPNNSKRVLEIGSYLGSNSLGISSKTEYLGIDISNEAVDYANKKFSRDNIKFICKDAHKLQSLNTNFDYIYGNGVLHHLDLDVFIPALKDVLKNNGKAVFMEPNIGPPWLRLFRFLTPSLRTDDEHPLKGSDYEKFSNYFQLEVKKFGIICPFLPMIFFNNKFVINLCQKFDKFLNKTWLSKWSWISVIILTHKE